MTTNFTNKQKKKHHRKEEIDDEQDQPRARTNKRNEEQIQPNGARRIDGMQIQQPREEQNEEDNEDDYESSINKLIVRDEPFYTQPMASLSSYVMEANEGAKQPGTAYSIKEIGKTKILPLNRNIKDNVVLDAPPEDEETAKSNALLTTCALKNNDPSQVDKLLQQKYGVYTKTFNNPKADKKEKFTPQEEIIPTVKQTSPKREIVPVEDCAEVIEVNPISSPSSPTTKKALRYTYIIIVVAIIVLFIVLFVVGKIKIYIQKKYLAELEKMDNNEEAIKQEIDDKKETIDMIKNISSNPSTIEALKQHGGEQQTRTDGAQQAATQQQTEQPTASATQQHTEQTRTAQKDGVEPYGAQQQDLTTSQQSIKNDLSQEPTQKTITGGRMRDSKGRFIKKQK